MFKVLRNFKCNKKVFLVGEKLGQKDIYGIEDQIDHLLKDGLLEQMEVIRVEVEIEKKKPRRQKKDS